LETFGVAVCFVVLHSVSWPSVLDLPPRLLGFETRALVCVLMATAAFPLLLLRVHRLAFFSPIGLVATLLLCLSAVAAPISALYSGGLSHECMPLDGSVRDDVMHHVGLVPGGLGQGISVILFSYGGHAVFPEIFQSMPASERPHFDRAVTVGFAFAGLFFCAIASVGYGFYGSCVADTVTLNLLQSSPIFGTVATLATLASTFLSFPMFCVPSVRIISAKMSVLLAKEEPLSQWQVQQNEQLSKVRAVAMETKAKVEASAALLLLLAAKAGVKVPDHMAAILVGDTRAQLGGTQQRVSPSLSPPSESPPSGGSPARVAVPVPRLASPEESESPSSDDSSDGIWQPVTRLEFLCRVCVVASAATLAIVIPNFGFVISLLGAVSTMLLSFIIPAAFYLHVHWGELPLSHALLTGAIILLGFGGMALGLESTLAAYLA